MRLSVFLIACALLASNVLRANTLIYENYTVITPYVNGSGLNIVQEDAVPFTVDVIAPSGSAYALSDIEFAGSVRNTESLNRVTGKLYDTVNGLPGDVLESFNLTLDPNASGAPLYQLTSLTNPVLATGQEYWFGLSDPVTNDLTWFFNGTGVSNVATLSGSTWSYSPGQYSQGALVVNAELVTASPEPASLLLLGGALALGLGRKLWK